MNKNVNNVVEKDKGRLAIISRIEEYEKKGWFSKDVEDDPPTISLTEDKVDYLNENLINRLLAKVITTYAYHFIKKLLKTKQMIIKEVRGIENYEKIADKGAVLTCNHFNPFDNFAIHITLKKYLKKHHGELYKVIREGNFTNFKGLYGLFFRHCYTLPLSSNFSCMKKFMASVDTLLKRGEKILVYAEQGMWWNYKKPRPLTSGAFNFAVRNDVPILPCFITMEDSNIIGGDGFPIQEYTIHFLKPIYPDNTKSYKENVAEMNEKNYRMWKEVYEKTYGIPLKYSCNEDESK